MLKLEVNTEKMREESEANFVFAKEDKAPRLDAGQARVKPASPLDFDGDREKGRAFINTCRIYFSICGDSFKGDQVCIHWALSFFKSDRALRFATRSCVQSSDQGDGTTRIGQPLRKSLRSFSAQRMNNSLHSPNSKA